MGYPDITQIVPLSKVFGVSTDEILGVNFDNDEKQVEEYIFSSYKAIITAGYERAIEILRDAQSKFPRSYLIKVRLANTLISSNFKNKDNAVYSSSSLNEYPFSKISFNVSAMISLLNFVIVIILQNTFSFNKIISSCLNKFVYEMNIAINI